MLKIYGSSICVDCREVFARLDNEKIDYQLVDITADTDSMREFLRLRDENPLFAEIREKHGIGIPFFVLGERQTFDTDEAIGWVKECQPAPNAVKLTLLGTGNAKVTECYNTCFVMQQGGKTLLVDGGGGSGLLRQLKKAKINWQDCTEIFITHKHLDHIMGIIWMMRMFCQGMSRGQYDGEVTVYGHEEVIGLIDEMSRKLLSKKEAAFIGTRVHLVTVENREKGELMGHPVTYFDIQSTKAKQFGFALELENGKRLCFCGDEPYNECERPYAENATWMLHEAFCLYGEAAKFKPYEKHHSTVKDACELAEKLGVENLLLYHTEDKNICNRRELYTAEGKQYYHGNLFVPDDLEVLYL